MKTVLRDLILGDWGPTLETIARSLAMAVLRDLILGDWAPTMEAIARSLAMAVAIPAAIALVFAQWLAFTWHKPLAGVLAVVPVRKPDPIDAISVAALSRSVLCQIGANGDMDQALADVAAAGAAIGLGLKIAPSMARPTLDAALDQALGLKRPVRPVGPDGLVLAPAPRKQRRGSKRARGTA
jgi:hypothetical protein